MEWPLKLKKKIARVLLHCMPFVTVLIFSASHCIFFIKPVNIQSIMSIVCKVSQGVNQHFNSFFVVSVYCQAFNIVTETLFCCLKFGIGLGILRVLFETLGILGGFDSCPHSIIPVTWNLEYHPPPPTPLGLMFSNLYIIEQNSV